MEIDDRVWMKSIEDRNLSSHHYDQGYTDIRGSRDAIRYGLQSGLIDDRVWMKSIEDRNLSSHHYDSSTVEAILGRITETYLPLMNRFEETMKGLM